jgi:hypothetical protein
LRATVCDLNIKAPQDIVVEHLENRALTLTLKALHSGVSIPQLKSRGFCRLVRFSGGLSRSVAALVREEAHVLRLGVQRNAKLR